MGTLSNAREFDHILLTRFNANRPPPPDEWLQRRLALFKRWAVPSVKAQTAKPDEWLVFCAAASPQWFRDEINGALAGCGSVVWTEENFSPGLVVRALEPRLSGKPYLITSRIDSDDAISVDFLQLVQECFAHQEREFINLSYGAQYCDGRFYFRADPSNAFVSLVERRSAAPPMAIFVDWHTRIDQYGPVRRLKTHTAWLQNVHGDNIANYIRGIPVKSENVLRYFALDIPVQRQSSLSLAVSKVRAMTTLIFRVATSKERIKWLFRVLLSRSFQRQG